VIEPSVGVDRVFLALLTTAYHEDEVEGEKRAVLRLPARVAPYKAAVFPLLKNKPELVERARALHRRLSRRFNVFYDEAGAIGRRYRRQDEIGTPYGITVDFDTLEKDAGVTVRDRDTLEQVRMSEDDLLRFLDEKVNG
jgi:glycyl-tRNA synthetase